ALSARRGRGRLLPRRDPLPDLLVPEALPRPCHGRVHDGYPDRELHRRPAVRLHAGVARPWPEELAMDVHPGGDPVGAARHRRPSVPDRPSSQARWLTQEQREWLANEMEAERAAAAQTTGAHDHGLREVLRSLLSWNVLRLALVYFGLTTG